MALLKPSPGLLPAENYSRFGHAFDAIDANTDRVASIPDILARILRINAGLYPSERPGDNPTAFTASRAGGDPDALAPLDTSVYPVRVVGDGLGVEVSGSREVWERTLHAVEDTRLWRGRWRYVRTQASMDPSGDSVVALVQWYDANRQAMGGPVQVDATTPGVGVSREVSAFIGLPGLLGVTVTRPSGAVYVRCGLKSYGVEGRTVVTDLAAIDVSAVDEAIRRLVPDDALPALSQSIDDLTTSLSQEVAARQDGDAATRTSAAADAEWPTSFYRTYTVAADGTGDFTSPALAVAAIQNLPVGQKPSAVRLYLLRVGEGQWSDTNVQVPDYVYVLGAGQGRTVFYAALPDNTALSTIATTSILRISAHSRLRGLSIWISNGRYALETDGGGANPDIVYRIEDVDVRHLGNDGARAYQAANGGNPALVWTGERAWGCTVASGQFWDITRSSFISKNSDAIYLSNSPVEARAARVRISSSRVISQVRRTATSIGFSVRLDGIGSRQRDTLELIDCEMQGAIATISIPWAASRPQDAVADRMEWRVVGSGCTPVSYVVYDDGSRALRLTSASTGPYSAITVAGGAVDLLLGDLVRSPGAPGLQGSLYGIREVGAYTLGARLGDRRGSPQVLSVTTDVATAGVTFDQDYRGQSNATILAAINAALAGVATADLLWVTELYRPEWRDQQARVYNGGTTTIRRKRGAALTGEDRTVRVMTPTDQATAFGGLALEDIRPGEWGRVQAGGAVNADADLDRAVAETIVQGGAMGVVDTTGRWGVAAAYPLLQAENLIELRFLPQDQSTRTAVRPYAVYAAFGDSISAGTGASDPSQAWVSRLGRHLHVAPSNFAIGGSMTADQQPLAYQQAVSSTAAQLYTWATGTNEGLANTPSQVERQQTFSALHAAALAWLAIPESSKCRGQRRARTLSVTSLTSDGAGGLNTRATATTSAPHGLTDGVPVQIAGAGQAEYNVLAAVTVTGPTTFTFPISGTPASPATGTITATTQDIAYTGAWADETGYFGGAMSVRSSAQGAAAQWDTWGDVAYLAYGVQVGDAGRFDVYVDGALAGSYRSDGPSGGMSTTYVGGTSHGSCLVRLAGLGRRRHTIRVVVTSTTGSVWLDWVSQMPVGGAAHLAGPTVLVGGTPITQDQDFGGNVYATLARVNAELLAGDGLNVAFVDAAAFMRPGTDLSPDRLHPNDTGHRHIYEAFRAALDTSATARWRNRSAGVAALETLTGLLRRVGTRLGLNTATPQTDWDVRGRSSVGMVAPQPSDLAGDPVHTIIQDPSSTAAWRVVRPNVATLDLRSLGAIGSTSNPPRADLTHADTGTAMLTWMLDGSARIGKGIIPKTDLHVLGRAAVSDTPGLLDADITGGAPLVTLATNGASGAHLRLMKTDVGAADLILQGTSADRSQNRLDIYDRDHNAYPLTVMLNGSLRTGFGEIVPLDTAHVEGVLRLSDAARGGSTRFLYPTADDGSLLSGGRSAELTLRNNLSALNVIALQNMNPAGFSAAVFRDQYGVEHGAVGWGNDGTGTPFVGTSYFEASVYTGAAHTTPPPPFIIVTTGFMKAPDAPGAYGTYERVRVRPDGFFSLKNLRYGSNDFNYDQYNARLGLRVQTPIIDLQVNGSACFADREAVYAPDVTDGSRLVLISGNGRMIRFIKADIGKVDWQFNGTAGGADRRMSVIDSDNGGIEVLSVMANGSGSVGIKKAAPAPGVTLDVGGPIRAGTYTVGTVPAGVVGAQIYVSNARKVGEGAGSGTGVLAYYSNGAWRRPSDDTAIAA